MFNAAAAGGGGCGAPTFRTRSTDNNTRCCTQSQQRQHGAAAGLAPALQGTAAAPFHCAKTRDRHQSTGESKTQIQIMQKMCWGFLQGRCAMSPNPGAQASKVSSIFSVGFSYLFSSFSAPSYRVLCFLFLMVIIRCIVLPLLPPPLPW